ncbi:unnamed protein product [Protopolystoma xenopodis]|uniref:Polycystin domain-containing protein n=1 Tax=Protopolystoma xenopodis TaxID=117903 RepID=A0A448X0E4_9PLAT|nr:unnamed protein product [Protopolystoma xenopodis]
MVGVPRLRQLRVRDDSTACSVPEQMRGLLSICRPAYSQAAELTVDIAPANTEANISLVSEA